LVAKSVTCTDAFDISAPVGSVTVPRIVPKFVPCAKAAADARKRHAANRMADKTPLLLINRLLAMREFSSESGRRAPPT
jgi:hypothetical protein